MELKRIANSQDGEVIKLLALYQVAFPESERFSDDQILLNLIDNNQLLHFNAIYEDEELAGLFMYWELEELYYIHYLAVYPEMRNRKIGKKVLDWIAENFKKPVFLEVDDPEDEISARRINFYERNGYQVLEEKWFIQLLPPLNSSASNHTPLPHQSMGILPTMIRAQ